MTVAFFVALALLILLGWRHQRLAVRCALAEQKIQGQEEQKAGFEKLSEQALGQAGVAIGEAMEKLQARIREVESERKLDHGMVRQQIKNMIDTELLLKAETANLVKALRAPLTRGRWGEIQLRRVVELAGMIHHCDFEEQSVGETRLRPDLIVRLPGGRQVVIDAKVPLEAYLEAAQAEGEGAQAVLLKDHARQVRMHVQALGKKAYWDGFQPTPEFVILFLPSEAIYSAALQHDPSLIEAGASQNVIIATPTTLIALLRAVSYGWKQESLSAHAEKVSELGHELYKRLSDMTDHWNRMGRALGTAVDAFNKATGSLESRVLVTARKFQEMGAAASHTEISQVEIIDRQPREIGAAEISPREL